MVTEKGSLASSNGNSVRARGKGGRLGTGGSVLPIGSRLGPRPGANMVTLAAVLVMMLVLIMPAAAIDPISTLECHRRQYTYKVHKRDDEGKMCWDLINVMSCWGRCDSNEIADWKFPYKRSHHPVCMHEDTQLTEVTLRHCDEGASPGTELYSFHEATSCSCSVCKSSEASCEGIRYRGARRAPRVEALPPRG